MSTQAYNPFIPPYRPSGYLSVLLLSSVIACGESTPSALPDSGGAPDLQSFRTEHSSSPADARMDAPLDVARSPDLPQAVPDAPVVKPDLQLPKPDAVKPKPDAAKPKPDLTPPPDLIPPPDLTPPPDMLQPDLNPCPTAGKACDDMVKCTKGDKIDPATCTCKGTPYTCTEPDQCHSATCDGKGGCTLAIKSNWCFIGGKCVYKDQGTGVSSCLLCDPKVSQTSLTLTSGSMQQGFLCRSSSAGTPCNTGRMPPVYCSKGAMCVKMSPHGSTCTCRCSCMVAADCVILGGTKCTFVNPWDVNGWCQP